MDNVENPSVDENLDTGNFAGSNFSEKYQISSQDSSIEVIGL
jgi:hypothetical protein